MLPNSNKCDICPHLCDFSGTKIGKCGVRNNSGIIKEFYGRCSTLAIDKIEKRPFFHFMQGTYFLSVGLFGCSLNCSFCINKNVSQEFSSLDGKILWPQDFIYLAEINKVAGIVFSYNEPTVHYEYLRDVATACIGNNLCLAIKTNGFINKKIARDLGTLYDAFNIDLKGDEGFYKNECDGELNVVKNTTEILVQMNSLVEISYLVNPYDIKNEKFHESMAKWISSLNKKIPVHLLYFYPYHKLKEQYPQDDIISIYEIFSRYLSNVYINNLYKKRFEKYKKVNQ